jgi:hypothetical protein
MFVLPMTALAPDETPAVPLNQLDNVPNLHTHRLLLNEPHAEPFNLGGVDAYLFVGDRADHTAFAQVCLGAFERGDFEDERV